MLMHSLRTSWQTLRRAASGGQNSSGPQWMWALRDVNFSVEPGDVVGIIGVNGAGKSPLLKILSRITDPTEGYVRLRGRVASLLEVETGFHPDLTRPPQYRRRWLRKLSVFAGDGSPFMGRIADRSSHPSVRRV